MVFTSQTSFFFSFFLTSLTENSLSLWSELSHRHNPSAACRFRKRTLEIPPSQEGRALCAELRWKCILFGALPVQCKMPSRVPVCVCRVRVPQFRQFTSVSTTAGVVMQKTSPTTQKTPRSGFHTETAFGV